MSSSAKNNSTATNGGAHASSPKILYVILIAVCGILLAVADPHFLHFDKTRHILDCLECLESEVLNPAGISE